jgi:hypothetical protein
VALLGSDEAVRQYISNRKSVEVVQDGDRTIPVTRPGTSEAQATEEPFRLASGRISGRKQGRLNLDPPIHIPSLPTRQPTVFDDADPSVARYLAVLVRIIAAHRGLTGRKVLGRKKVEKLVHVIETHLDLDLGRRPVRAAAGPLDMERHKAVCRIAEVRDIFRAIEPEIAAASEDDTTNLREAVRFEPLGRFDQAVNEAATALGDRSGEVDGLIAHLMKLNPAQAEIVATLYAVWNDQIRSGNSPRDEELFRGVWAWHPDKAKFTQTEMFVELAWMRQVGIVPRR